MKEGKNCPFFYLNLKIQFVIMIVCQTHASEHYFKDDVTKAYFLSECVHFC